MNKRKIASSIGLLAILLAGLGANYGNNMQQQSPSNNKPPPRPRISPEMIAADEAAVASAQASLETAVQAQSTVADKHRAVFEQSKEWQTADAAWVKAKADLTAAKTQVVANLAKNSDYIAAIAAKQKAASDLVAARASGDATPDVLGPLASAVLEADGKVKKMEEDAMTNDPAVVAAKANVVTTQQPIDDLNAQFQATLPKFPEWASAHQAVIAAQKQLVTAQAKLAADH